MFSLYSLILSLTPRKHLPFLPEPLFQFNFTGVFREGGWEHRLAREQANNSEPQDGEPLELHGKACS